MEDPTKNPSSPSTSPTTSSTNPSSLPPLSPKPLNSNPNPSPYPTTFIQADTHSFKQVVQMLTGSADIAATKQQQQQQQHSTNPNPNPNPVPKPHNNHHHHHHHHHIPPISKGANKKPAFKLYERRPSMKNLKMISPLIPSSSSAAKPEILSPSILDFPSLVLSPVTPLSPDPFNRSPPQSSSTPTMSAEDRAIADKGFYLHPSPRGDADPPKLLPLFPLSPPRMDSSSPSPSPSSTSAAAAESAI